MPKGAYIGINDVAHKIKKGYIGVDGVARRIKKAYIGIGGVARPCWGTGELIYYGTITPLSAARSGLAATTVGNYALFGGGGGSTSMTNGIYTNCIVDAYSKSLTRTTPTTFDMGGSGLAATTVGNYALFGGGNATHSAVYAYDTLLKRTTTSLSGNFQNSVATTVGNYALFNSGSAVNAYDTSLTRTIPTALSVVRSGSAATTVRNYALFGGGSTSSPFSAYSTVDVYDTSLTRTTTTPLSVARGGLAATTVGNYALFGGGLYGDTYYSTVDAYDISLTRTIATTLSAARCYLASTTVGDYALFGGGEYYDRMNASHIYHSTVDAYDTSLTRTIPTPLNVIKFNFAATTVGNYALFGGGQTAIKGEYYTEINFSTIVDVYTV